MHGWPALGIAPACLPASERERERALPQRCSGSALAAKIGLIRAPPPAAAPPPGPARSVELVRWSARDKGCQKAVGIAKSVFNSAFCEWQTVDLDEQQGWLVALLRFALHRLCPLVPPPHPSPPPLQPRWSWATGAT